MTDRRPHSRPSYYDKKVALLLQGGGALGSYQAGVWEALADSDYPPDWVAGVSIGAINAAIIAGNAPQDRAAALRSFWREITAPTALWPAAPGGPLAVWRQKASALCSLIFGQPGFFAPRAPHDWLSGEALASYYSTEALRRTLERLVDFARMNTAGEIRLSVGAVNLRTSQLVYFDSREIPIRPEHIMASAALPPGFPPVEIDGESYWDGGLVSNTPLQYVLDYYPRRSRLCFQVDLFPHDGWTPRTLEDVCEREKDIRFSSRTKLNTDAFREKHEVRHAINELHKLLPEDIARTEQARRLYAFGCVTEMDIVQLIYQPGEPEGPIKDYEFSRSAMNARWAQGFADAAAALRAAPWLAPKPRDVGVRVFDFAQDIPVGRDETDRPQPGPPNEQAR